MHSDRVREGSTRRGSGQDTGTGVAVGVRGVDQSGNTQTVERGNGTPEGLPSLPRRRQVTPQGPGVGHGPGAIDE